MKNTLSGERIDLGNSSSAWWPCHVGKNTIIGTNCNIGSMAHIGRDCIIGNNVRIQGGAYVADLTEINDYVFLGPNCTILNDKYPPSGSKSLWAKVVLRKGSVLGGGATVNPGLTIGENAILGSGSVLTKNLPDDEVWAGNPARFLMTRKEYEEKRGGKSNA